MTIALHAVLNFPQDKIKWMNTVIHTQILTGRKEIA